GVVMGSPRPAGVRRSSSGSRSVPLKLIEPDGCRAAGYGSSLRMDKAVIDLPDPDSPTSASVSPLPISNEMRLTASVSRPPEVKAIERSRTLRRGSVIAVGSYKFLARIEGVAHRLADEDQQ